VLRYVHEYGCTIGFDECLYVAEDRGHGDVVEYLRDAQLAA